MLACLFAGSYAKKKDQEDQALNDLYAGMAGLKEAAQNPALLAQLMRDLQVRDRTILWFLRPVCVLSPDFLSQTSAVIVVVTTILFSHRGLANSPLMKCTYSVP